MPLPHEGITQTGAMREPKTPLKIGDAIRNLIPDDLKPESMWRRSERKKFATQGHAFLVNTEIQNIFTNKPENIQIIDQIIKEGLVNEFAQKGELPHQLATVNNLLLESFPDPRQRKQATQIAETYINTLIKFRQFQQASGPDTTAVDLESAVLSEKTVMGYKDRYIDSLFQLTSIIDEGLFDDTVRLTKDKRVVDFISTFNRALACVHQGTTMQVDRTDTLGLNKFLSDKWGTYAERLFGVQFEQHHPEDMYLAYSIGGNFVRGTEPRIADEIIQPPETHSPQGSYLDALRG